jgi:hypothetical protein
VTLTGPWFWTLFGAEFLIAGAAAFHMAWSRARAPFCESCKRWYGAPVPAARGSADKQAVKATLAALEASDWPRLAAAFGKPTEKKSSVLLFSRCPGCSSGDQRLLLQDVTALGHSRQKVRERLDTMVRPDEARAITDALSADQQR